MQSSFQVSNKKNRNCAHNKFENFESNRGHNSIGTFFRIVLGYDSNETVNWIMATIQFKTIRLNSFSFSKGAMSVIKMSFCSLLLEQQNDILFTLIAPLEKRNNLKGGAP